MSISNTLSKSIPSISKMTSKVKIPSMPSISSMKMPSMKMPSMKMPSMESAGASTDNVITNIYLTIFKNISIILMFMVMIICVFIIIKMAKIKFKPNESTVERTFVFKKNIKEGHGEPGYENTYLPNHTGDVNQYCLGGCPEYVTDEKTGVKTCKTGSKSVGAMKYDLSSNCCSDIRKKIWEAGKNTITADGKNGHWQFDWDINPVWQEKHKEWYCHCHLGVKPDVECCNSWITDTIVKPDHPDSNCKKENEGKSMDFTDAAAHLKCAMKCMYRGGCKKGTTECRGGGPFGNPFGDISFDFGLSSDGKMSADDMTVVIPPQEDPPPNYGDSYVNHEHYKIGETNEGDYWTKGKEYARGVGSNVDLNESQDRQKIQKPVTLSIKNAREGFRGVTEKNCDTSFNIVENKELCKAYWETNCKDNSANYCSKKTKMGEDYCLEHSCCLWENDVYKREPEIGIHDNVIVGNKYTMLPDSNYNQDKKDIRKSIEDRKSTWTGGGRCIKGAPKSGPYDKQNLIDSLLTHNSKERKEKKENNKSLVGSFEENVNAYLTILKKDKMSDEEIKLYKDYKKYFSKKENIITTNYDMIKKKRDALLTYKNTDLYYYTEYKHRKNGGEKGKTDYWRYFNNGSSEVVQLKAKKGKFEGCPPDHPFAREYKKTGNWYCYKTKNIDGDVCSYDGDLTTPGLGKWGTNQDTKCHDSDQWKDLIDKPKHNLGVENGYAVQKTMFEDTIGNFKGCPASHPFAREYRKTGNWYCYKTINEEGDVCSYDGDLAVPFGKGTWGANQGACFEDCPPDHPFALEYNDSKKWFCYKTTNTNGPVCNYKGDKTPPYKPNAEGRIGTWGKNENHDECDFGGCPASHPFAREYKKTGNWYCYKTINTDGEVCSYGGNSDAPNKGIWGTNQKTCE